MTAQYCVHYAQLMYTHIYSDSRKQWVEHFKKTTNQSLNIKRTEYKRETYLYILKK